MSDFIVFDMGVLDHDIVQSFENMKTTISKHKPKDVLFIAGWELTHPFFNNYLDIKDNQWYEFIIIHEFGDFLEAENTQFHLIVSSFDDPIFDRFKNDPVKNFNIHFWKSWCLFGLVDFLRNSNINIFEKNIDADFEKLFVCFINKGKYHRQVLIDLLCKNDLFKNSIVTWHKQPMPFIDTKNYEYECWTEVEMSFDDYYPNHPMPFIGSSLDTKCLINLVTETHREGIFYSEKTWKPIVTGQPFISLGAKNQNNVIKELGFQLYDELFDYEFDSLDTVEQRAKGLVDNLLKLDNKDLLELYDSVKEKLEFNKNRAKQILNEGLYIPNIILDLYSKHSERNDDRKSMYGNVVDFLYDYKKDKI